MDDTPHIVVISSGPNWRWSYRDPGSGIMLDGNQDFGTREEAAGAAALAYPGIRTVTEGDAVAGDEIEPRSKLLMKLIGALLAAAGLVLVLKWIASLEDEH